MLGSFTDLSRGGDGRGQPLLCGGGCQGGGSGRGLLTLLFLAGVGCAVPVPVMYGGRGKGLWSPRRHVFGARGIQSAGSILKRRDTASEKRG